MTTNKKTVWETLSVIDVGNHTEDKNGFTYLSWAWAWSTLKDNYPEATFVKHMDEVTRLPFFKDPDSRSGFVRVTVNAGGESATETFPILDYQNKAIENPNAMQVNTALQRGMAKAISYLGLGAYIYAGEDLPPVKADTDVVITNDAEKKTATGADMIFTTFKVFMDHIDDVKSLEEFYQKNSQAVRALQTLSADKYEEMIAEFKKRKEAIIKKTKEKEPA